MSKLEEKSKQSAHFNADQFATLSEREKTYFSIMRGKSGVLYITSKPGIAKSSIARSIATKMGYKYMDIRLSMVDETDVGLFPNLSNMTINNQEVKVLDFAIPKWAVKSNQAPTIIHFEELNRASLPVRNAALQILLERCIGTEFEFGKDVLMMCSGNLGEEDGTDVEEFDNALNNRLIHYKHSLSTPEWIENYAKDNVHPTIVSYIKANPERLYQEPAEGVKAFATPRSWTFLSDFIIANFGHDATPSQFIPLVQKVAGGYVGNSALKFVQYCEDMIKININDVINRFDDIKDDLKKYNRDKNSELIGAFKEIDIKNLKEKQLQNAAKWLKTVGEDELTGYLLHLLDTVDVGDKRIKGFMLEFKEVLMTIKKINKPGQTK
jgi:hypothetical protein